mgnify:FL=1|tara:strand:+ start:378 stop:677 length:300 start_codon:yes stop_codon:yes gene_type:complete
MNNIYCFDIDDTICMTSGLNYENSTPHINRIKQINQLYNEGNIIKLYTARGSKTGKDWSQLTKEQIEEWGLKYHELHFGKPFADYYIDDKGSDIFEWFS